MCKRVSRFSTSRISPAVGESVGGFSLFEFTIVLVIIGLLIVFYFSVVESPIRKSQEQAITYQANTFSRAVSNLNGMSRIKNINVVTYDDTSIFFNEFGWPANTTPSMSPKSKNQTPEECLQLWYGIFRNPPPAEMLVNSSVLKSNSADYLVSSINGYICRYELARKQDGYYYFDYDVKTGTVIVSTP